MKTEDATHVQDALIKPDAVTEALAAASDLAFAVSADGTVRSVLNDGVGALNSRVSKWNGRRLQDVLTIESVPKFEAAVAGVFSDGKVRRAVELNHTDKTDWEYPVRYSFHRTGELVLMLGHDLRLVAETQQQLVQAQFALEHEFEERRAFDARYAMLMATTAEALVFLSVSDGRIADINAAAANLLGCDRDDLVGSPVGQVLVLDGAEAITDALMTIAVSDFDQSLDVQTVRSGREIVITPTMFRAAGERMLICRLQADGALIGAEDHLADQLVALFQNAPDAMVLTDPQGGIQHVNEAFLEMASVAHQTEVKARNLSEFLSRGSMDLNVMLESAMQSGRMRVYATKLGSALGTRRSVEISAVAIRGDQARVGFILRDTSQAGAMRAAGDPRQGPYQKLAELVGSMPMKEIVAETNDVVERMCIETAVELTRNNRVAAAEMLGMSRQSLYVKLRKFGLLQRDVGE